MVQPAQWIQDAVHENKKGALHRQLGYKPNEHIPTHVLNNIKEANVGAHINGHTVTPLLKERVNFALNVRK